jgi:hypothetical protein
MDGPAPRLEYVVEDVFNPRRLTLTNNSWPTIYDGLGSTIESAVLDAHKKIPTRRGFDYVACRVLEWGYQRGGFADSKQFFVKVVEELGAFKT